MRIAVCDDAPVIVTSIEAMLKQYAREHPDLTFRIATFSCAEALLELLEQSRCGFDLYLLDILMNGKNGIELARMLRAHGCRGQIVFLTSSPDYALPAFEVKAAGYLLKPVEPEGLYSTMDDAVESYLLRRDSSRRPFSFRTPDGIHTVPLQDIVYVEVMGHTPYFHLTTGAVRGSEMRISFEESMAELLQAGCFVRPHRSYLVNAAHIAAVGVAGLTLDNGAAIPLARMRAAETKAAYQEFLSAREGGTP